ncbi:MAG: DUF2723 domain-containing protein [Ardenticatenaceae bacterium]|nr:DUF2723 domain-containing protein [Ardenticatenaceae bacterium]
MSEYIFRRSRGSLPRAWRLVAAFSWQEWLPFILPLLLYGLTLAPTIYNLDSAELTTAVASNGIIRATGYPLYLVLGKVWSWLPLGDMGYRMNLFSAVCGAVTIWLADRILRRWQVGAWARWGAIGLLATAPYMWAMSLIAEVYTLHTALMAGVVSSLLWWGERPSPWRLALPLFLMALSMGNHAATVLLIPGCVWYVLTRQPRLLVQWRTWVVGGTAVALGLTVFLILPYRYGQMPAFNYAGTYDANGQFHPVNLQTWAGFWWLISGKSFSGQMFGYTIASMWPEVGHFVAQLWNAFFVIGIGPGLLGIAVISRRDWRLGGMLALMFCANAIFYINYRVVDKDTMFLPAYLIWALWLGIGYDALLKWLWADVSARRFVWVGRTMIAGAVLLALAWNWSLVDRSDDWGTRQRSEDILAHAEPNAIIFGWWETVPGVQYLQLVEGQRPDVLVINRFLIGGNEMNQLILRELGQRPIYINNPSIELLRVAKVTPVGPLYLLEPRDGS